MEVIRKQTIDTEIFEVGDVIKFKTLSGQKVKATAVREVGGNMLFITDCTIGDDQPMFKNPNGMGSMQLIYENSDLRRYLNGTLLGQFPEEIRSRMVEMPVGDNYDLLRIPTEKEIFGENEYGADEDKRVKRFKGMKKRKNRIAVDKNDDLDWYWLQNRHKEYAALFALVRGNGFALCTNASNSLGVRPAFLLS